MSGHLGETQVRDALGWINAEDRLPEGYGDYLVCYFGHNGRVVEQANYCGKWMLFRTDSSDDSITVNPTHWRTVPEPPEEAMTDLGESKAVPERYKVEYDDCSMSPVPSETWEWDRMRLLAMYDFAKRLMEELGTAEAKVRELEAQAIELGADNKDLSASDLSRAYQVSQQSQTIAELHQMIEELGAQHSIEWHAENKKVCEQAQTIERLTAGGAGLISAERQRQIDAEGWTAEHDDRHDKAELTCAAMDYCNAARKRVLGASDVYTLALNAYWRWDGAWWKPSLDPVRNLVKAGALIAAEIDRLQAMGATNAKP